DDGDAPAGPLLGKDVILGFFRRTYLPTFRRGEVIYSSTRGREVRRTEACFGPPSELIELLAQASDSPRTVVKDEETGQVTTWLTRQALPKFFRNWAPTAWQDLISGLQEEEDVNEMVEPAAESFRAQVSAALHHIVALGYTHKDGDPRRRHDDHEVQVERRSL